MLKDKVVLVTGAASGIGRASAISFAKAGALVVALDHNEQGVEAVASIIRDDGGQAVYIRCDVLKEDEVAAAVDYAVRSFGRLDGAFNNAGVEQTVKPIHEVSLEEWNHVVGVNLTGVFLCLKHEFRVMKALGGSIVNTASVAAYRVIAKTSDYAAAKHGVIGLTKAAAADGGELGIRVNAVSPGVIRTPMIQTRLMDNPEFEEVVTDLRKRHVIGRFGEPDDIANAAKWLLSDQSSFVTGTSLLCDGGFTI